MNISEIIKGFDKEHTTKNIILIGEDESVRNIVIKNENMFWEEEK